MTPPGTVRLALGISLLRCSRNSNAVLPHQTAVQFSAASLFASMETIVDSFEHKHVVRRCKAFIHLHCG